MRKALLMAVTAAVLVLAFGCGGGGGGGDDGGIDPGTSLIGRWAPVSATRDGSQVKVSEVLPETLPVATRWDLLFEQNGRVTFTGYGANGAKVGTFTGTWSSDNQIAPVTLQGEPPTNVHWSDFENLMTVQYLLDGKQVVAKWVRVDPAPTTGTGPLLGSWIAQSVSVTGVARTLSSFFSWDPGSTAEVLAMNSNGTGSLTEMAGGTVVTSDAGTWAESKRVVIWASGGVTNWGYWEGATPNIVITHLDPLTGDTVAIGWQQAP